MTCGSFAVNVWRNTGICQVGNGHLWPLMEPHWGTKTWLYGGKRQGTQTTAAEENRQGDQQAANQREMLWGMLGRWWKGNEQEGIFVWYAVGFYRAHIQGPSLSWRLQFNLWSWKECSLKEPLNVETEIGSCLYGFRRSQLSVTI